MSKTIGILGGMGPLATADLFRKITLLTPAKSDNEHIRILIDSNTAIPDRTAAILSGGISPVHEMRKSAQLLECMGADVIMMPCNTAHYFIHEIENSVRIPFINMIDTCAEAVAAAHVSCAGLIGTTGALKSKIYHTALEKYGIKAVTAHEEAQQGVMDCIYNVKAGRFDFDISPFTSAIADMREQGATHFVLACTETPLIVQQYSIDIPCFDATEILAQAAVDFALK